MNNFTTFYIVRHGETEWNVQRRAQGHTDIPLNETGRKQAKELAEVFKDIQFDLAFSSDLLRAKETTEIIALEHSLTVQTTQLLRERRLGEHEGKYVEDFQAFDRLYNALTEERRKTVRSSPGAENDAEVVGRLITFIRETAVAYPDKTILIGTHSGLMRILLAHIGFISSKQPFHSIRIKNGAYIKILSDGADFFIKETYGIEKK